MKKFYIGIIIIIITIIIIQISELLLKTLKDNYKIKIKEELPKIEHYLNSIENNGFINHLYNNAKEIKVSEILYNNIVIGNKIYNTDIEYKEINSKNKIIGDLLKFDELQIKILYFDKTGLDISQNIYGITLEYSEQYKIYWSNHTDSHYTKIKCISGLIDKNGLYKIIYNRENDLEDKKYEVIMKKNGQNFLFISNKEV